MSTSPSTKKNYKKPNQINLQPINHHPMKIPLPAQKDQLQGKKIKIHSQPMILSLAIPQTNVNSLSKMKKILKGNNITSNLMKF